MRNQCVLNKPSSRELKPQPILQTHFSGVIVSVNLMNSYMVALSHDYTWHNCISNSSPRSFLLDTLSSYFRISSQISSPRYWFGDHLVM